MKMLLLAGIIIVWIAGFAVAIYGFRSIGNFTLEIEKKTQDRYAEIFSGHPLCRFFKDLYVGAGIWETILWCLFITGALLFIVYGYYLYKSNRGGKAMVL